MYMFNKELGLESISILVNFIQSLDLNKYIKQFLVDLTEQYTHIVSNFTKDSLSYVSILYRYIDDFKILIVILMDKNSAICY